jgi:hypothetical protein
MAQLRWMQPAINSLPAISPAFTMLLNTASSSLDTSASALRKTSFWFAAIALLCLLCADLDISTVDPWHELGLNGSRCS